MGLSIQTGLIRAIVSASLFLMVSACSHSPIYINDATHTKAKDHDANAHSVHFKFDAEFHRSPPNCIAVMPLRKQMKTAFLPETSPIIQQAELTQLRTALYAQLEPYSAKRANIAEIDQAMVRHGHLAINHRRLGQTLNCDSLLFGEVTRYDKQFFGVYSQASIGVKLRLVRANDNRLLWQGSHIAASHSGSFPLTPVDIALGVFLATSNVSDKQIIGLIDDVFQRLLLTWERRENFDRQGLMQAQNDSRAAAFQVMATNLNLRSGPGMKFSASTALKQNEIVTLLNERHTPWLQVKMSDGQLGYVHQRYLSVQ